MAAIPKKPSARRAPAKPKAKSGKPAKLAQSKLPKLLKPPKPLDYMLAVLRDEAAEPGRRDEMAKLAAPYVHAKATELAELGGKGRKKPGAAAAKDGQDSKGGSDADPIIRTARATLHRKLARLAAKSAAENAARRVKPGGGGPAAV